MDIAGDMDCQGFIMVGARVAVVAGSALVTGPDMDGVIRQDTDTQVALQGGMDTRFITGGHIPAGTARDSDTTIFRGISASGIVRSNGVLTWSRRSPPPTPAPDIVALPAPFDLTIGHY